MIRPFILASLLAAASPAGAHDIYTGVRDKSGTLCCGAYDCALTTYRERGGTYALKTRENHWVTIPQERITFLPVPGDPPHDDSHAAHLCYRTPTIFDEGSRPDNIFEDDAGGKIYLYCAFIPPGGT